MLRKTLCRDSNEADQCQQEAAVTAAGFKPESEAAGVGCKVKGQTKSRTRSSPGAENEG